MTTFQLRDYQRQALDAICAAFFTHGQNRLLMQMATGLGKTQTFAQLLKVPHIATWLRTLPATTGGKMLVIAHREELLAQAQATIQRENPGLAVSIEQGELYASRYSDVVIASIQTLSSRKCKRLLRLMGQHTFRIVVVDEAHHAPASTYRTVLAHLGFLPMADVSDGTDSEAATYDDVEVMTEALKGWDTKAPKDRLLVGVTATPNRSDAIGLAAVFQSIVFSYGIKPAIDDGWLVPIMPWTVETTESLDKVRTTHGDFNQRDLAETVNTQARNRLAVAAWREHAEGKPTIAFTVDVAHAHALAKEFNLAGIVARAVSGDTSKEERRHVQQLYRERQVHVLANCAIFTEGVDLPLTECILNAKPTKSATLFTQMCGRGLRTHPGKTHLTIIDMVDVAKRHSLQAAPVLYGLPPGMKTVGKSLQEVSDEYDALREKYPSLNVDGILADKHLTLAALGAFASTFDVWTVPTMGDLSAVIKMSWLKTGTDTFRLSYPWEDGTETVTVQPDLLGHFDVVKTLRTGTPAMRNVQVKQATIGAQIISAAEALQFAEAFMRQDRQSATRLTDANAPWKSRPATVKQMDFLVKLRVTFDRKTLTMGEASNLINMAKARSGR